MDMLIAVTGSCEGIDSAVVRYLINSIEHEVLDIDSLIYLGNRKSVGNCRDSGRYHFERLDICNGAGVERALSDYQHQALMHLAAESYDDRFNTGPAEFIYTNVVGTYSLFEAVEGY